MDPTLTILIALSAVILGLIVGLGWRNHDVEDRVKTEKHRLGQVDETTKFINDALSGTVMVGIYNNSLRALDSSTLYLIREVVYDIDLARRMRESKEESNESNHN